MADANPPVGDRLFVDNVIVLSTDAQDVREDDRGQRTSIIEDVLAAKDRLTRPPISAEIIPITPTADFRPYVLPQTARTQQGSADRSATVPINKITKTRAYSLLPHLFHSLRFRFVQ